MQFPCCPPAPQHTRLYNMFLKSSLSTLVVALLATTAAAVPFASSPTAETPNEAACARGHVYSCCTSAKSGTSELTNSLGTVLPLLSGVDISSKLGLSCLPMKEYTARGKKCTQDVMCCSQVGTVRGLYERCANAA